MSTSLDPNVQQAVERLEGWVLATCFRYGIDYEPLNTSERTGVPPGELRRSDIRTVLDALSAVTKERDEESELREKLAGILRATAVALKGPEPPLTSWSWHDLAEVAASQRIELAKLREALDSIERGRTHTDTADLLAEAVSIAKSALSAPAPKLKKVWLVVSSESDGVSVGPWSTTEHGNLVTGAREDGDAVIPAYMEVQE